MNYARSFPWPAALASVGLAVAGCSSTTVGGQRVIFEGPVDAADFVGKRFPVFVLVGETGDPTANSVAGRGAITYNADGSITLELPGRSSFRLEEESTGLLGTTYSGVPRGGSTVEVLVSNFSSTDAMRLLTSTSDDTDILGAFGFETAVDDRPTSGTYSTAGAVFLTTENVGDVLPVAGTGTLMADFMSGSIEGTLLDADPASVALAGVVTTPDDLALTFMLENGVITSTGFRGDVSATGELVVDGSGAPVPLTATVSDASVDGGFFGDAAEALAGTFQSNVNLSDGGSIETDIGADGFFTGTRTGP